MEALLGALLRATPLADRSCWNLPAVTDVFLHQLEGDLCGRCRKTKLSEGATYLLRVPDGLQHRQEPFLLGTGREEHHQIVRVLPHLLAFEFLQQDSKFESILTSIKHPTYQNAPPIRRDGRNLDGAHLVDARARQHLHARVLPVEAVHVGVTPVVPGGPHDGVNRRAGPVAPRRGLQVGGTPGRRTRCRVGTPVAVEPGRRAARRADRTYLKQRVRDSLGFLKVNGRRGGYLRRRVQNVGIAELSGRSTEKLRVRVDVLLGRGQHQAGVGAGVTSCAGRPAQWSAKVLAQREQVVRGHDERAAERPAAFLELEELKGWMISDFERWDKG